MASLGHRLETLKSISRECKVSSKVFKLAANYMTKYLKFPAATNSLYNTNDIHTCLLQLSLRESYAESGLANLSLRCNSPNKVPTGRTFRARVERVKETEIRKALTQANDEVLSVLKGYGVFRRKAVVAIDYTRKPFYGDPNTKMVIGGPHDRGTTWGYCYASIHVVEAGRRLTLYTMPVSQFTEKSEAIEKLLKEAKARGVHVGLVLLDRAFFTVDVITALKGLGLRFIMPAIKNNKVKEVIRQYDKAKLAKHFTLGNRKSNVTFNLAIYQRPKESRTQKKQRSICEGCFAFATNLSLASGLPAFIPQEYRRRWGIETGYRVQGNVEAKTTSRKYCLRLLYQLTSVFIYNVWQYANLLLCRSVKTPFMRPLLKLTSLAAHFEGFIIGGLGPPRH